MKNKVIIKGNKYGVSVVLDPDVDFQEIVNELKERLTSAERFFDSDRQIAIAFENRDLSNDELDQLLTLIQNESKLNIQYVLNENSVTENKFQQVINKTFNNNQTEQILYDQENIVQNEQINNNHDSSTGMFYKGTLRSGQKLESDNSIVIIGDVNPGASVIAGGNIVIIGSLTGSVQAGARGNRNCFVMALSMSPIQIQIADIIARSSDKKSIDKKSFERIFSKRNSYKNSDKKSNTPEAMIATVLDDHIYVESISKSVIQDIRI